MRQRAHRRRGNGGAAAATQRDDSLNPARFGQGREPPRRRLGHGRHARAAIPLSCQSPYVYTAGLRHLRAPDVGPHVRRLEAAHVDQERAVTALPNNRGDEFQFPTFGVECAQDNDGSHVSQVGT